MCNRVSFGTLALDSEVVKMNTAMSLYYSVNNVPSHSQYQS